ncbi:hypothetical protein A33M_4199 [Rhodovulum sp. PH10]|uniref:SLOG domain-containing protein n=1 Tax=Rhodovulum sp. PH10 TaxID=1187851 RepID=UPI00027C2B9B|nr:hypothetical protein [Rhodovulum sp. PH10]EJW10694.1 hypothetical protein A33M_4199 [Rhodovulum sp. PH10]
MLTVFLSASVPLPDRDPRYFETADVLAIRDAVKALVGVVVPRGKLVFGGHPAITPLIRRLVEDMRRPVDAHVRLYQSAFFADRFPAEVAEFEGVTMVPAVDGDRQRSLDAMRTRMLTDQTPDAGVFIGGMEGVEEEYRLFRERWPQAPAWPIASTGAAARALWERFGPARPDLSNELAYPVLFRDLLGLDAGPGEAPPPLTDR